MGAPLLKAVASVSFATFALSFSATASAATADVYDLDSLAWLASDIVEAELVQLNEEDDQPAEVKVIRSYEGDFQEGAAIPVLHLASYRKAGEESRKIHPLSVGDQFILFLEPVRFDPSGSGEPFEDPGMRVVVPSGIRLIEDDKVIPFIQFSNPGPVIAPKLGQWPKLKVPAIKEFRGQLSKAMTTAMTLERRFSSPASVDDIPWLLELLRKRTVLAETRRSEPEFLTFGSRDKPAEEAAVRLAKLQQFEALDEALFMKLPPWHVRSSIQNGFNSPEGREFLLKRVSDQHQPLERQLTYVDIIREIGRDYNRGARNIRSKSAILTRENKGENAAYITRLARVATTDDQKEELRDALLDVLVEFAEHLPGRPNDDPVRIDLRKALPSVVKLHRQTESSRVKYDAERFVSLVSRSDYEQLDTKSGQVLSLLEPLEVVETRGANTAKLGYRYSVRFFERHYPIKPRLTLVHLESGRRWSGTPQRYIPGTHGASGTDFVTLPRDLPRGKYRVFFRFFDGDKIVSEGYGFETEL